MAHGLNSVLKRNANGNSVGCKGETKSGIGSRRIFPPHFKLQVLDSYRNDADCKGNQRATARKYGIHRRQIQKWLQAESNLRNSVGKGKLGDNSENPDVKKCGNEMALMNGEYNASSRQRDDSNSSSVSVADTYAQLQAQAEQRVPSLSPGSYSEPVVLAVAVSSWNESDPSPSPLQVHHHHHNRSTPLDFSTHSRSHGRGSPIVASPDTSPIPANPATPMDLSVKKPAMLPAGISAAPVPHSPLSPPRQLPSPPSLVSQPHPDVWDLSTKGQKRKCLDDDRTIDNQRLGAPKPVKLFKPYLDDIDVTESSSSSSSSSKTTAAEAQNHPSPSPASYHSLTPPCCNGYLVQPNCDPCCYNNNNNNIICDIKTEYTTYTLHELQPKSYYYTPSYLYPTAPAAPDYDTHHLCLNYEDTSSYGLVQVKQRQSYSLDFKLSAIDCYYQDSVCKGNQRAVASKYNVHRKQVQKWLLQAEELRQKNEHDKQIHAVS